MTTKAERDQMLVDGVVNLMKAIKCGVEPPCERGDKIKTLGAKRDWPYADSFFGTASIVDSENRMILFKFEDGSVDWYEFEGVERE